MLYTVPVAPHFGKLVQTCILWPNKDDYANAPTILGSCSPAHWIFEAIPFIIQPIPFVIATIVISVMYYKIIKEVHARSKSTLGADSANFGERSSHARNRVAILLIVTAVVFFLCSLPYFTVRLNDAVLILSDSRIGMKLNSYQYGIVLQIVRGLGVVNSIINPVIYSATSPRYRQAFLDVFTCGFGDCIGIQHDTYSISASR